MKKHTCLSVKMTTLLVCLLTVLLSFHSAIGAEDSKLTDINGTPFFESVFNLNQAGIIAGYPDGTFRPYRNLSRAEALTMVFRAYGHNNLALTSPFYFKDVASNMWAARFIDYGAGAGIVNGYPDHTFRPDAEITYNEVITLIVRARGMASGNLSWPDDYLEIARNDGMLDHLYDASLPSDGNLPANRGNTAMLIASGSSYNETAVDNPLEDRLADPNMSCMCYGLLTRTTDGTDRLGNHCGQGRLLMGDISYDLLTSNTAPGLFSGYNPAFGLLRIHIENGRAVSVKKVTASWTANHLYGLLTPASPDLSKTEFCRVNATDQKTFSWQGHSDESGTITLKPETVFYNIGLENGKPAASRISSSEVRENDMAAVYSLSEKGEADLVIVVHPQFKFDILHVSEHPNVMYMG